MLACAELFKAVLDSKDFNYNYKDLGEEDVISFPYQGKVANCFFSGDDGEYVSIYLVFDRVPEDRTADAIFVCNELNCKYKWVTFYVDKDNDLMFHDDAILSVENAGSECLELLVRMLDIAGDVKPVIMKAFYA